MQNTFFVDDLTAELWATRQQMWRLVAYVKHVCQSLTDNGNEISKSKSVFSTSDGDTAKFLQYEFKELGISNSDRVKSLGTGLGVGIRRNVQVMSKRLK